MPPPPPSLSAMSEEELRELEQEGRRGLEARLQCLQNIHTLLDAAMLNIHHYLTTVATLRYTMTCLEFEKCCMATTGSTHHVHVFNHSFISSAFFFCSPPRAESRTGEVSGSGKTEASSQENGTPISEGELVNTSLCRLTTKSFVITYFILVFAPYRSCQWCDRFFPTRLNHRSREGGEEGGRGGRGGRGAECC